MSWKHLADILGSGLEDVLKLFGQDEYIGLDQDQYVSEDVWLRLIYSSWSRRLEDVFKTSSEDEDERSFQDVCKTPSLTQMFAGLF